VTDATDPDHAVAGIHTKPVTDSTDPDEQMAFALLADALVRQLELRPECRDQVLTELWRERELVRAWLQSSPDLSL